MRQLTILLFVLAFALVACDDTGDRAEDETSVQNLMPNIVGYTTYESDNIQDAIITAGAGAALTSGNAPLAAAIARADFVLDCLRDRGAVDAQMYVETQQSSIVPQAGAVLILSQTRLERNILSCLTETGPAGAQSLTLSIEPCADAGSFTRNDETYSYLYVGAGGDLCGYFVQHFDNLGAVSTS
jgi:hypothetical protein